MVDILTIEQLATAQPVTAKDIRLADGSVIPSGTPLIEMFPNGIFLRGGVPFSLTTEETQGLGAECSRKHQKAAEDPL